jgi:hypothetical protein
MDTLLIIGGTMALAVAIVVAGVLADNHATKSRHSDDRRLHGKI